MFQGPGFAPSCPHPTRIPPHSSGVIPGNSWQFLAGQGSIGRIQLLLTPQASSAPGSDSKGRSQINGEFVSWSFSFSHSGGSRGCGHRAGQVWGSRGRFGGAAEGQEPGRGNDLTSICSCGPSAPAGPRAPRGAAPLQQLHCSSSIPAGLGFTGQNSHQSLSGNLP